MKIFKPVFLAMCIIVSSCTNTDNGDVFTSQDLELSISSELSISEEQSEILNRLFEELKDHPDFYYQPMNDQIDFLAAFLSQYGYSVDLKDYSQYLYRDNWSKAELSPFTEIDNYVYQAGIDNNLPGELDKLKQDIISSDPLMTQEEVLSIEHEVVLWNYLSTNENFLELYNGQIKPENAGINWKCFFYAAKFPVSFVMCVLGSIPSCVSLPLDIASIALSCGDDGYNPPDPCASSSDPCCGIYCPPGYVCSGGSCFPENNPANCSNCHEGEQCIDGICMPY